VGELVQWYYGSFAGSRSPQRPLRSSGHESYPANKPLHRTRRVCHAACGGEELQASRAPVSIIVNSKERGPSKPNRINERQTTRTPPQMGSGSDRPVRARGSDGLQLRHLGEVEARREVRGHVDGECRRPPLVADAWQSAPPPDLGRSRGLAESMSVNEHDLSRNDAVEAGRERCRQWRRTGGAPSHNSFDSWQ
jgi:hypothetical protein